MFANLDYPIADERFRATRRARGARRAGRPRRTSEPGRPVRQQRGRAAGGDDGARSRRSGAASCSASCCRELVRESGVDAVYIPSAPCGGDLPFRPGRGIGTYYGVGCYRLPLEDVRRAGVRFAAECLAFSHVPDEEAIEEMLPRRPGGSSAIIRCGRRASRARTSADWDFEDIRDHYLKLLFGVDAAELRRVDRTALPGALARADRRDPGRGVRRVAPGGLARAAAGSCCGCTTCCPGAGWGVIDHRGSAQGRLPPPQARACADRRVDGRRAAGRCRRARGQRRPRPVERVSARGAVSRTRAPCGERLRPRSSWSRTARAQWNVEAVIGHFVDAGMDIPLRAAGPGHDRRHAEHRRMRRVRERERGCEHPLPGIALPRRMAPGAGVARTPRPLRPGTATARRERAVGHLQSEACLRRGDPRTRFLPSDDGFSIEPGGKRVVTLRPRDTDDTGATSYDGGILTAPNLAGRIPIESA